MSPPCFPQLILIVIYFSVTSSFQSIVSHLLHFPPDTSCANALSRSTVWASYISHLSISYPPFICRFSPSDFCDAFFHFHQFFYFHSSRSVLCSYHLPTHLHFLVFPCNSSPSCNPIFFSPSSSPF